MRVVSAILIFFLVFSPLNYAFAASPPGLKDKLDQYFSTKLHRAAKTAKYGVIISDVESGSVLYSKNSSELMVPASVVKIITSVAALKMLGGSYRFPSEIFVEKLPSDTLDEKQEEGYVGNLYFRGYGDPSFISERMWRLSDLIKRLGVKRINNVVIDDTLFIDPPSASGSKPYQAALSATSLNHNCYQLTITPTSPGRNAFVTLSDNPEFDLENNIKTVNSKRSKVILDQRPVSRNYKVQRIKYSNPLFNTFSPKPPKVIVKGSISKHSKPRTYYQTAPDPTAYFAAAFANMLRKEGILVSGSALQGETPSTAKQLHVFESGELPEIIRDLNHYSNNFIAGQLLFALGQDSGGYFRMDYGIARLSEYLRQLGIEQGNYELLDGSGLDKRNRLTAEQLNKVLVNAYKDFSIRPYFIASLSKFGSSGTLKKRALSNDRNLQISQLSQYEPTHGVWGKTGTLTSVSTLAGYAQTSNNKTLSYVVLVNGKLAKSTATSIEDNIVKIMLGEN